MRVVSVVGARPQFIKAFPVSRALRSEHEEILVHTGQHYDESMSEVFFEELALPRPDHQLGVGSGPHAAQTAAMMTGIEELLEATQPDVLLVYGDTNSTLAGALVGAKRAVTVAHVEAGLRSGNWSMPEEVNRVLTDHSSELLFAPTERAVENLRAEGRSAGVHRCGDVMYDAVERVGEEALETGALHREHGLSPTEYVLATVHRAGNTDDPARLDAIVSGLGRVELPVVIPVHPRTRDALEAAGLWERATRELTCLEPVGYLDFLSLLAGAHSVATDSGGVQKEAFYLDTPCVTLREETEWVETVECGYNQLVGADEAAIIDALSTEVLLPEKPSLYGDGNAAREIVSILEGSHSEAVDQRGARV